MIKELREEIGEIDFIIGRDRVLFVILQVSGFPGMGERLLAMPANAVDMQTMKGKVQGRKVSGARAGDQTSR